jgi:hypothetical protein
MRARGPRTAPLSGAGGLDSQRSGAEMGDSRSGLLPRPIAPQNGSFVALGFVRFVGESRPASRRYPLRGRCREPLGFLVIYIIWVSLQHR